ncbi:MAG: hypothetical protein JST19_19450 [Bacteroidetes bacterium]|nr:hypothetical protein [Bacteroidota bacterium]
MTILNTKDPAQRHRDLVLYIRYFFGDMPERDLTDAEKKAVQILRSSHESDREGLILFIDAICRLRLNNYSAAQDLLIKAIESAEQKEDHYLLYACFTHMGFIQNDRGNPIEAISSFRAAKKEATIVNDAYMQVIIDVNLSDIYYRNKMFGQALFYLNEAQGLMDLVDINVQRTENVINYNKAEVFFHTGNLDSLKKYNESLVHSPSGTPGLYTYQKRTGYYIDLLQHKYSQVINTIINLRKDTLYLYGATDENCLADAYFRTGMLDSAKAVVERLITNANGQNHAEFNMDLYRLLGDIEIGRNRDKEAAIDYKIALSHSIEQLKKLVSVGSVSSQIRIDQVQNSYLIRTETLKRQRLWLIFVIVIAVLLIAIGALLFYYFQRKRYYEKLLFKAKKDEIAFINSHEVRRHASNIMGIMQVINQGDKYENFVQSEKYLLSELTSLDEAIKNISSKLNS